MDAHHFPPELLQLMIDGIPRLYKSKQAVVDFFHGAGVPARLLGQVAARVRATPNEINKYEISRAVLTAVNDDGDASLGPRREIVKRIVEHEDFSTAWPNDVQAAKAFVADARRLVTAKDAVTRVEQARQEERRQRLISLDKAREESSRRRARYAEIRDALFALFGEQNVWKRGKQLEGVVNDLFALHGIQVKEAFVLRGNAREGIVEQIDGVIVLDGHLYLVEMKWHAAAIAPEVLAMHWMRVAHREGARGLFISASEFTPAAVTQTRDGLALKTFVLATLQDLVQVLQADKCLVGFLRCCVDAAITEKNPRFTVDIGSLPRFT